MGNFKVPLSEYIPLEEEQEETLGFRGNSIGRCGIHRGIGYRKPRGAARRLRRGLPATYYVSSRKERLRL